MQGITAMRGFLALVFIGMCAWTGGAGALTAEDFKGKNIVVFLTDQERATMHFPPGWEKANLPGMTRLKAHGMTFNRAYGNAVTCSPARACFLTGLMPSQHRVRWKLRDAMPANRFPQEELPTDIVNLAHVAKAAGYTTVWKGKMDAFKGPNGTEATPEQMLDYGFSRWNPPDSGLGNGFSEFGGGTAKGANYDYRYMHSRAANQSEVDQGLEGALQYITEVAPLQQPFFLVVSLVNPHDITFYNTSIMWQAGYNESITLGDVKIPASANEVLLPNKPLAQFEFKAIADKALNPLNTTELQHDYVNGYANLLKQADSYLVEFLDALTEKKLIDNTLIIRSSDHGEMGLSHSLQRQKCYNYYEETVHIPMIWSNPRLFTEPRTSDALVSHIDFLPTLAEVLGQANIATFTGYSYAPILYGQKKEIQDHVIFVMEDYQIGQAVSPYVQEPNHMICVREIKWKFCKYYDQLQVTKVKSVFEMYNMKADPNELINLASPIHKRTALEQQQFERLKRKLKEIKKTRLVPRRMDNIIALNLNVTFTGPAMARRKGNVIGRPVGNGDVTLDEIPGGYKIIISSGSGIIRGMAQGEKVSFTSGTGTYKNIASKGLTFSRYDNGTIRIDGTATY